MHSKASSTPCSCELDFGKWYVDHQAMIRHYILSRTHDPVLAEDCTNTTFLRALTNRNSFSCHGQGVRPWLFTIARNIVRDHHKSGWRQRETTTETFPDVTDLSPSPEEQVLYREMVARLIRCINQLPNDQADCIRMRFLREFTVAETAKTMRRAETAVRALQVRAIRGLREIMFRTPRELREPNRTSADALESHR